MMQFRNNAVANTRSCWQQFWSYGVNIVSLQRRGDSWDTTTCSHPVPRALAMQISQKLTYWEEYRRGSHELLNVTVFKHLFMVHITLVIELQSEDWIPRISMPFDRRKKRILHFNQSEMKLLMGSDRLLVNWATRRARRAVLKLRGQHPTL